MKLSPINNSQFVLEMWILKNQIMHNNKINIFIRDDLFKFKQSLEVRQDYKLWVSKST